MGEPRKGGQVLLTGSNPLDMLKAVLITAAEMGNISTYLKLNASARDLKTGKEGDPEGEIFTDLGNDIPSSVSSEEV